MDETKSSHLADNPPDPMVSRWLTEVYMVSHLLFFSILGTLARLGTQWITFYPGAPLTTPVIWANMAGSLVMGFLAEDLRLFRTHDRSGRIGDLEPEIVDKAAHLKAKKTIPLYIGLTVGFCGSFTSFSSFARDFFLALSNDLPAPIYHPASLTTPSSTVDRHAGYSFEAVVGVMASTLALSLGGLMVGSHLALAGRKSTPSIPPFLTRKLLDPIMIILGWGCWLGAILLVIWPPDRPAGPASRAREVWRGEVLFALVFAPLGCLLRYYASLRLNGLVAAFPLGTFAVNMFGTAVESMCYDIQHVGVGARVLAQIGGGRVGCQVLQGVMDGFCGCLTTVSTWVLEIRGLRLKHAYVYVLSSLLGGLGLTVAIMGSVRWSHGFSEPACNTGYSSKVHG
jgi:fluoride ion exporter CrcB/FEX